MCDERGFTDIEVLGDNQEFSSGLSKCRAGKTLFGTMRKKTLTLLCPWSITMTTQHLRIAINGLKHDPLSRLEDESITMRSFLCGVNLPSDATGTEIVMLRHIWTNATFRIQLNPLPRHLSTPAFTTCFRRTLEFHDNRDGAVEYCPLQSIRRQFFSR
jgi:hypothetical protein